MVFFGSYTDKGIGVSLASIGLGLGVFIGSLGMGKYFESNPPEGVVALEIQDADISSRVSYNEAVKAESEAEIEKYKTFRRFLDRVYGSNTWSSTNNLVSPFMGPYTNGFGDPGLTNLYLNGFDFNGFDFNGFRTDRSGPFF